MGEPGGGGPWRRERCYVLDWAAFGRSVDRIATAVRVAGEVDAVLGIARGGMIPAAAVANLLDVRAFHACAVRRTAGTGEYLDKIEPELEWMSPPSALAGSRLLVVDDVSGSGVTIEVVRRACLAAGAASVRVAVPVVMEAARHAADHTDHVLDDWVVFPWEPVPADRVLEAL